MNPLRFGWQGITALVAGVGVAAGVGYGVATLALDPGSEAGGGDEPAIAQRDGGGRQIVIRALGDSVTAGFGFRKPDGGRLSGGEVFDCLQGDVGSDECQDPDGVAYPAVFGRSFSDADIENLAVSGSTPADWLGFGEEDLSETLGDVVEADPDLTALTIGANPLLDRFLQKGDRLCASLPFRSKVLECVRNALEEEELQKRLGDIYRQLLDTPDDGRHGRVVVFQYPETHPPSAFGVRTRVLFSELRAAIAGAAQSVSADPDAAGRLMVAEAGPFIDHGCTTPKPWILSEDTCIHPNAAGHVQMARVLSGLSNADLERRASGAPEEYATPGHACPLLKASGINLNGDFRTTSTRLVVGDGRMPCSVLAGLYERYVADSSPCPALGAGTCHRTYGEWRCHIPTLYLYPANFSCSAPDPFDPSPPRIFGIYPEVFETGTIPVDCGEPSYEEGGGPFEVRANFGCEAALRIASAYSTRLNWGFACSTESTGIESSSTECRLDNAELRWINGA